MGAAGEREREHGREELRGEGRETEYREAEADPDDINNRTLKKTCKRKTLQST